MNKRKRIEELKDELSDTRQGVVDQAKKIEKLIETNRDIVEGSNSLRNIDIILSSKNTIRIVADSIIVSTSASNTNEPILVFRRDGKVVAAFKEYLGWMEEEDE